MGDFIVFVVGVWLVVAFVSSFYFWTTKTISSQVPIDRRLIAARYGLSWPVLLIRYLRNEQGPRDLQSQHTSTEADMGFFKRKNSARGAAAPSPQVQAVPESQSPLLNGLARNLDSILDEAPRIQFATVVRTSTGATAAQDEARAFMALDWLVRVWTPSWTLHVPGAGEEVAVQLRGLSPIRDLQTAEAAGKLVGSLEQMPSAAGQTIGQYRNNFYEEAAATAARSASSKASAKSGGNAAADAAASAALEACLAARTDVALQAVSAIALLTSLDSVTPYIDSWAAGPGDFDAKKISIGNLAPHAAWMGLESIVDPLQKSAVELYRSLISL